MPELQDPTLGTPSRNKIMYAIQQTGSRLIGDEFLAGYLIDCLKMAEGLIPVQKYMMSKEAMQRGIATDIIAQRNAQTDNNLRWLEQMESEDFHRVNVLSFLSLWAAYESGNENIIAAILESQQSAADSAAGKFPPTKYAALQWPWTEDICLDVASKLDQKAKSATPDGGWDIAARLTTLLSWLGVDIEIPAKSAACLNEASMVRNVLLHRYGRLGPRDIERAPHLDERGNKAIKITRSRLRQYSDAVRVVNVSIMIGVEKAGWA